MRYKTFISSNVKLWKHTHVAYSVGMRKWEK